MKIKFLPRSRAVALLCVLGLVAVPAAAAQPTLVAASVDAPTVSAKTAPFSIYLEKPGVRLSTLEVKAGRLVIIGTTRRPNLTVTVDDRITREVGTSRRFVIRATYLPSDCSVTISTELGSSRAVVGTCGLDGADGAAGPQGPQGERGSIGPMGATGPAGAAGADGADGVDGVDGAPGTPGAPGADGTDGEDGTDGTNGEDGEDGTDGTDGADATTGASGFLGTVASQAGLGYRFIGGTTSVTVAAGQRLIGSGTAALGTDGAEFLFRLDLCYQNTTPLGPLTSFVPPADSLLSSVADATILYSATPTAVVTDAGTYNVGLCLDPIGGNMNDNGTANGWIMAVN